jgi:hypothetical protein
MTESHEATAKAKLPCKCGWTDTNIADGEHRDDCPAYYRPAVVSALAEARKPKVMEFHEETARRLVREWQSCPINRTNFEHTQLSVASVAAALAERDAEVERLKTLLHNHTVSATNENAQLRAEVNRLTRCIEISEENVERLGAERDAAFVRGILTYIRVCH